MNCVCANVFERISYLQHIEAFKLEDGFVLFLLVSISYGIPFKWIYWEDFSRNDDGLVIYSS